MENKKASQEKKCNTCSKGISNSQYALIGFSFYILGSAIYGTIKLVEYIISVF